MKTRANIVEQHADGATFLFALRQKAVRFPHFGLPDLRKLESRLDAHLEGLEVAGDEGWNIVSRQLDEWGDSGEMFAATSLALTDSPLREQWAESVVSRLTLKNRGGLVFALTWHDKHKSLQFVEQFLASRETIATKAAALEALARLAPANGSLANGSLANGSLANGSLANGSLAKGTGMSEALNSAEPVLFRAACEVLHHGGSAELGELLIPKLGSQSSGVRDAAALTLGRRGFTEATNSLLAIAGQENSNSKVEAIEVLGRLLNGSELRSWINNLKVPTPARAILAIGTSGQSRDANWLIEQMRDSVMAPLAGAAFAAITGVDIEAKLTQAEQSSENDPTENDPTENDPTDDASKDDDAVNEEPPELPAELQETDLGYARHLPLPDAALVAGWWRQNEHRFDSQTRYLAGRPLDLQWAAQLVESGLQPHRLSAANFLAVQQSAAPLVDVTLPAHRQIFELQIATRDS